MTTHTMTTTTFGGTADKSETGAVGGYFARMFERMLKAREAEAMRRVRMHLPDYLLSEFERAGTTRDTLGIK
ncbi:MAG: hypothetical protein AAFX39_03060 [Pseudomonadota bacterium]